MARRTNPLTWDAVLRSRLFQIAASLVILVLVVGVAREVVRRYEINQQIAGLQKQIDDLEQRKSQLSNLVTYFSSPLFQEQEARDKLGKAKPGEHVVIVPLTNSTTTTTDTTTQAVATDQSGPANPVRWWRYFFP